MFGIIAQSHGCGERLVARLGLIDISKHFGAIRALAGVSIDLEAGQVLGLMGDNGAGKSTLVKVIAGNFAPTHGSIVLDGQPCAFHHPRDAQRAGIEVVYQDLALCDNLTAASNVFLGRELMRRVGPARVIDYPAMYRKAAGLFAQLKSETRPRDLVRRMSGGQRQAVAIARTLLADPKVVLMDEPTAAISVRQVAEVLDLIRRLRDRGIAVMLISHRMPDVFAVCDRIAVLRRGELVADTPTAATSPEEVTGIDHRRYGVQAEVRGMSTYASKTSSAKASTGRLLSRIVRLQVFWIFVAAVLPALPWPS